MSDTPWEYAQQTDKLTSIEYGIIEVDVLQNEI